MASHGVPRGPRTRTDEQKRLDVERIKKYRELEDEIRASIARQSYDNSLFQLTTRLLKLNPEYYTVWNARRRCLTSGLLSRRSSGYPSSAASTSSWPTATTTLSSGGSLSSSSATTRPSQKSPGPTSATSYEGGKGEEEGRGEGPQEAGSATGVATAEAAEEAKKEDDTNNANDVAVLTAELQFTIPLLLEFPKCYWIWSYRIWILEQAVQRLPPGTARRIWEEELALDSKMLTKDRRNFHAWGYRRQVIEKLESPALSPQGKPSSLVESEFAYTTKMVRMDLSNFSAWHNRSKLIPRLLDERGADDLARQNFLDEELGITREALNVGPEDQSLWFYHQFLMINLTDYIGRPTITPHFTLEERMTYAVREMDDIKDLLLDYDDVKWIYEALLEYTIAISKLNSRALDVDEIEDIKTWLSKLRELDPMRNGRWDDIEVEYILGRHRPSYEKDDD